MDLSALTVLELRRLEKLLSRTFPGVQELRKQLRTVKVASRNADGVNTLVLSVPHSSEPAKHFVDQPSELTWNGHFPATEENLWDEIAFLLWVSDGYLASIEVVSSIPNFEISMCPPVEMFTPRLSLSSERLIDLCIKPEKG